MTTDEEIKRFFTEYHIREKIMPYNILPAHLQKMQHYIFVAHSDLDGDMLVRILSQIRYEAGDELTNGAWKKINMLIQTALEEIPYVSKIGIIGEYGDVTNDMISALIKVNTHRNEFAHKRTEILIQKYDIKTSEGKIKIRDLTRAIKRAQEMFLEHTQKSKACIYYVEKQIELSEAQASHNTLGSKPQNHPL